MELEPYYPLDTSDQFDVPMHEFNEEIYNRLTLRVGSNYPGNGDAGHGGRTIFALHNDSCTSWGLHVEDTHGHRHYFEHLNSFTLILGGDSEHITFTKQLYHAARALENPAPMHRTTLYVEDDVWAALQQAALAARQGGSTHVSAAEIVRRILRGQHEPLALPSEPVDGGMVGEED